MSDKDPIRQAMQDQSARDRREARAARTRAQALSPFRILLRCLLVPLVTFAITISVYVRTSPYEREDAMRHLFALQGCDAAVEVGLAPAFKGDIGYHTRNDPDGDGVACDNQQVATAIQVSEEPSATTPGIGAKFLRP